MNDINTKSNTYLFVEVVLYSESVRSICRVNQVNLNSTIVSPHSYSSPGAKHPVGLSGVFVCRPNFTLKSPHLVFFSKILSMKFDVVEDFSANSPE